MITTNRNGQILILDATVKDDEYILTLIYIYRPCIYYKCVENGEFYSLD